MAVWGAIASLTAMALHVPGSDAGWQLLLGLTGRRAAALAPNGNAVETSESATATMRFRRAAFASRPPVTPSPSAPASAASAGPATDAAPAAPEGSIPDIVYAAAAEFGIDGPYLLAVAHCESTLNPNAYNPAGYHGLFQFDFSTWGAYGYGSIYDPVAQARTAARLLAAGQASRWPNCA
jgi:soluble lytic murein transglycosylase-like protein